MWPGMIRLSVPRVEAWDGICSAQIGHTRNTIGLMSADEGVEPR